MSEFDIPRMIACAEREVKMRETVYRRRVNMNQMRKETAEFEIEGMKMIVRLLEAVQNYNTKKTPDETV